MKKVISVVLCVMMVFTLLPANASASSTEACSGYVLGTFNGSPACVDSNGNLHICEKNFQDLNFMNAVKELDNKSDNVLTSQEVNITALDISKMSIANLSGIEFFTSLTSLDCSSNQIKNLNVSNLVALNKLICSHNQLSSLDTSNNTLLEQLECGDNEIRSLNVSKNNILDFLDCNSNLLSNLDTSNNTVLRTLDCSNNQIKAIDISKNVNICFVYCEANKLDTLDISHNPNIFRLDCGYNNLTVLDISSNCISSLSCEANQLTILNTPEEYDFLGLNCSNQKRYNVNYYKYQNNYLVNLGELVGKENVAKIASIEGKSIADTDILVNYNKVTGIATFMSEPKEVTYICDVRIDEYVCSKIDVTLSLIRSDDIVDGECHKLVKTLTCATLDKDGVIADYCSVCNKSYSPIVIPRVTNIKLSNTSYTYNGKVQKPTVVIKDVKGSLLRENKDYTLSYATGRKSVGKYTVKVNFKGNYRGSKTLYFTIIPNTTSISNVVAESKRFLVKWLKKTSQVDGYQLQYSTSSKFSKSKTVSIGKNSTTATRITKLSAKKKYYVRVRTYKKVKVNGKNTYLFSSWSKTKNVTTKK